MLGAPRDRAHRLARVEIAGDRVEADVEAGAAIHVHRVGAAELAEGDAQPDLLGAVGESMLGRGEARLLGPISRGSLRGRAVKAGREGASIAVETSPGWRTLTR